MILDTALMLVFPAAMAFAAASDLITMTISNRVSLVLLGGFFLVAPAVGMSAEVIASHLGAGAMVLAITFALFAFGWIGGGDAKLAAATALWLGFDHLLTYVLYASIFGGILTLILLRLRTWPLPASLGEHAWVARLYRADSGVPYGIALALSALMIYPETIWMMALAH